MRQIYTILLDSYRLLLARKLFKVSLVISCLVALLFTSIGFTDKGISFLFGLTEIEQEAFKKGAPFSRPVYLWIFSTFIVGLWLTWAAIALALISTANIFNELQQRGAVDVMVSKPISRWKLFLTKYAGSLLFVLIQVALFSIVLFFCMGWRLGEWNPRVFLSIPLITLVFSYLYSVQVLASMVTRSTIASLLIVFAFWAVIGLVQKIDAQLGQVQQFEHMAESIGKGKKKRKLDEEDQQGIAKWRTGLQTFLTPFPKTRETTDILDQELGFDSGINLGSLIQMASGTKFPEPTVKPRSRFYILGTSLLFEVILVGIAGWVFVRRDF